jgi:GDP-L-fucose synthase
MTILVTGANGMLGHHFSRALEEMDLEVFRHTREHADLRNSDQVKKLFSSVRPSAIIHCAALVGGIKANIDGGVRFYSENLIMDQNVFTSALEYDVQRFLYIGSSCMYPANRESALQPDAILSGPLESTNYYYALSKIAGTNFVTTIASQREIPWRTFVASNLYGPQDHFDSEKSHLISSIISKVSKAKDSLQDHVEMWGSGIPRREFTFTPDFAGWSAASLSRLEEFPLVMNVGYGEDFSVYEFYQFVLKEMNLDLEIRPNLNMPSGNLRKLMDSSTARGFGWNPQTTISEGLKSTIDWYMENVRIHD